MTNLFSCEPFSIYRGNATEVLKELETKVDCVITSPPYYNQRTYGPSTKELGKERSAEEYINDLVSVFKAIPLEPWGSIWVNIGDKRGKHGELLNIAEERCRQAHLLRSKYEAMNLLPDAKSLVSIVNNTMQDEVGCDTPITKSNEMAVSLF